MAETQVLRGSCHCGQLGLEFSTAREITGISPRACDCSFCQMHGAAYVSDPAGRLSVFENEAGALRFYRQGSKRAQFLLCANCGVLVAVVMEEAGRLYGAANAACIDGRQAFAAPVPVSPQLLGPDEKVSRWQQAWVADVLVVKADASVN
ncbi:GFA family protein [Pinirhizobacter soli]|uniref:GFA family protein n=1 Tax=Pinirhizobacter soli TaxID=2786953 RepID=UPI00202A9A04|nr:aldehyde-activating protein [Pinirhizobacter soli]